MVSNEIRNCGIALGELMHQVTEGQAAMIRIIKSNLMAVAELAVELEQGLCPPIKEGEQTSNDLRFCSWDEVN